MYTNTTVLANDLLCRGYQTRRMGTSTAYVVVTSTIALYFDPTISGAGSLSV
jgi:hypothetical protein